MRVASLLFLIVSVALAGCGGSDSSGKPDAPVNLPRAQAVPFDSALMKLNLSCTSGVEDESEFDEPVTVLISTYRAAPTARLTHAAGVYSATEGITVKQALVDTINEYERCLPAQMRKLERVVQSG